MTSHVTTRSNPVRRGAVRLGLAVALVLAMVGPLSITPASALAPTTFDPAMWQVNGRIRAMVETPDAIYLAGKFTRLTGPGGQSAVRTNFAALNPDTGAPLPFVANVNQQIWNIAISPDGSTVYAVGDFTTAGGAPRNRAAAFNATTGAVKPWNPNLDARGVAVEALGSRVYLGGEFLTVGGQSHTHLAAVDALSGALLTDWTATADDGVDTITATNDGSRILAGGRFESISGSPGQTERKVASLDPATGELQPWADHPNIEIFDLEVSNSQVFAAGGGSGGHAVAWNLSTGEQQWSGFGDGDAVAVELQNDVLYIGGHMTSWGGVATGHLLAVDPATGIRIPWSIKINSNLGIFSLASYQGQLSIGGDFTKVNDQTRLHYARFSETLDSEAPSTPGQPAASEDSASSVDLVWDASTDDSAGALDYTIYRDGGTTPVAQVTSSSSTTVSFTDTGLGLRSTHYWQVQASDGTNFSDLSPASDPFTLPQSDAPVLTKMNMLDRDDNGLVDTVVATFSSNITCTDPCIDPWTLTDVPSGGSLASVLVSGNTATLALDEGPGPQSTAVGTFTVALAPGPDGVVDSELGEAGFDATAPADKASPVPVDFDSTDGHTPNYMEIGDTFSVTFSEPIDPATVIAATVKEFDPLGPGTDATVIVGLTNGPMDLLDNAIVFPNKGTLVHKGSTLTMADNNTTIVSTVMGGCSGTACRGGQGFSSNQLVTYLPEPNLRDLAGNQADGSHREQLAIF